MKLTHISPSSVNKFDCPRSWAIHYVLDGDRGQAGPAAMVGSLFHELMEKYTITPTSIHGLMIDAMDGLHDLEDNGHLPEEDIDRYGAIFERWLNDGGINRARQEYTDKVIVGVELRGLFQLDPHLPPLMVIIDRLDWDTVKCRFEVEDYKSGAWMLSSENMRDDTQARAYGMVMGAISTSSRPEYAFFDVFDLTGSEIGGRPAGTFLLPEGDIRHMLKQTDPSRGIPVTFDYMQGRPTSAVFSPQDVEEAHKFFTMKATMMQGEADTASKVGVPQGVPATVSGECAWCPISESCDVLANERNRYGEPEDMTVDQLANRFTILAAAERGTKKAKSNLSKKITDKIEADGFGMLSGDEYNITTTSSSRRAIDMDVLRRHVADDAAIADVAKIALKDLDRLWPNSGAVTSKPTAPSIKIDKKP